jgi:hypothetical protein
MQHSPDKPVYGIQPSFPGLCLTDQPTPLLLAEKGLGDEVAFVPGDEADDSVRIEEMNYGFSRTIFSIY